MAVFERFTERSRRVLVLAQEEARALGHDHIGTEHLLLGLLAEGDGVAAAALGSLGAEADDVRRRISAAFPAPLLDQPAPPPGKPPFSGRAKRALELSLREALQLGHNYIGTEHLLLALVRMPEGRATEIMSAMALDPEDVRARVIDRLRKVEPVSVEEPTADPIKDDTPPRCPQCHGGLADITTLARRLSVSDETGQAPIDVVIVYCRSCGIALSTQIVGA